MNSRFPSVLEGELSSALWASSALVLVSPAGLLVPPLLSEPSSADLGKELGCVKRSAWGRVELTPNLRTRTGSSLKQ